MPHPHQSRQTTESDKFHLLCQLISEAMIIVGEDGRILEASALVDQLMAGGRQASRPDSLATLLGEHQAETLQQALRSLDVGERWTGHLRGEPEADQGCRLACSASALPDGSFLLVLRDESERLHRDEELMRRNREAVTLYEVGRQINACFDTRSMLEVIVRNLAWLFECQFAAAVLRDDAVMPLTWRFVMGTRGTVEPALPVLREDWPWVFEALEQNHDVIVHAGKGTTLPEHLTTLVIAPVSRSGIPLGLLLHGYRHPHEVRDEELRLLLHLADQSAIAIENARLYQSTMSSARRLRALASHVTSVQEEERGRLSRELHDGIGQALTAVRFNMDILTREVPIQDSQSLARVAAIKDIIDETLKEIRQLAFDLRPPALDELGLPSALRLYVNRFGQQTGIDVHLATAPTIEIADKRVESVLYRVTQESLTNVARHSGATRVMIHLDQVDGLLKLQIEDNGRGFVVPESSTSAGPGLGVLGMKERVTDLGGTFVLTTGENKGTRIHVEIGQGVMS